MGPRLIGVAWEWYMVQWYEGEVLVVALRFDLRYHPHQEKNIQLPRANEVIDLRVNPINITSKSQSLTTS